MSACAPGQEDQAGIAATNLPFDDANGFSLEAVSMARKYVDY